MCKHLLLLNEIKHTHKNIRTQNLLLLLFPQKKKEKTQIHYQATSAATKILEYYCSFLCVNYVVAAKWTKIVVAVALDKFPFSMSGAPLFVEIEFGRRFDR